jgi:hypothetical protein
MKQVVSAILNTSWTLLVRNVIKKIHSMDSLTDIDSSLSFIHWPLFTMKLDFMKLREAYCN